ncbi:MAG: hypothetical protein ABMA02_16090 [Saprospiraceae bacterium]
MNKYRITVLICLLFFAVGALAPACSTKSGCQATESLRAPVDGKGNIKSSKSSKSGLFPKSMTKKMKKGK